MKIFYISSLLFGFRTNAFLRKKININYNIVSYATSAKNININTDILNEKIDKNEKKAKKTKSLVNKYIPKTENQKIYKSSLYDKNLDLLFCMGPAGCGKTLFACQYAIQSLKGGDTEKIIITRPIVSIEENLGYLPGSINEKMHPWTIPIFDIFQEYYTKKDITGLIAENIIEIAPLGFMQGRTFKNSIIIADEMQNSTPLQMFMFLTRIGENSKMIVTGDLEQTTNKSNGLQDIIDKLNYDYYNNNDLKNNRMNIIRLDKSDVQRHFIVSKLLDIYKK
jgi:phosphate starvation-inducible PhoH-like protein